MNRSTLPTGILFLMLITCVTAHGAQEENVRKQVTPPISCQIENRALRLENNIAANATTNVLSQTAVIDPASIALFASGLAGLVVARRKQEKV